MVLKKKLCEEARSELRDLKTSNKGDASCKGARQCHSQPSPDNPDGWKAKEHIPLVSVLWVGVHIFHTFESKPRSKY